MIRSVRCFLVLQEKSLKKSPPAHGTGRNGTSKDWGGGIRAPLNRKPQARAMGLSSDTMKTFPYVEYPDDESVRLRDANFR